MIHWFPALIAAICFANWASGFLWGKIWVRDRWLRRADAGFRRSLVVNLVFAAAMVALGVLLA